MRSGSHRCDDKASEGVPRGRGTMRRRPARLQAVRYTPCPESLEDRRLLAEILRPYPHVRPPYQPAGQAASVFRGAIRAEATAWQVGAAIPLARTEVAAAVVAGEIV